MNDIQRMSAEQMYKDEIEILIKNEKNHIPNGWKISP